MAKDYLAHCKRGDWKKEHTIESLKCFNLERVIDADIAGKEAPMDVTLEEYIEVKSDED